ncbi:PrsW family intramembrane metalloprotease [Actinokineospora sp. G85]|uniref:PrsW family intramembrane metalloprotease n=1 Tax=Actinokineospora sp. G85 TaxID=3406626 RepID=UPI003C78A2E4
MSDPKLHRHTPRRLTVLLPVLALLALAACGLILLAISTARVGLAAELVGVGAALVPVGPVVAAFLWVDRWEPEPARLLWTAFAWGACGATITALLINNTAEAVGDLVLGHGQGDKLSAIVSAPIFEEAAKGVFLLGIYLFLRSEFDGVVDGIVYAGFTAAGFAFTENIYYFGRAFSDYGIGDSSSPGVVAAFILRGVLSPFTHPLFTVMIGIGIGLAARTASTKVRVFAPLGGYLVAVALHAAWNASATLGSASTFFAVYFLVMVPLFGAVVWLISWHRKREQGVIAAALPAMVESGWILPGEVEPLADLAARRHWRKRVRKRRGRVAAAAVEEYQASVSELAFLWHAMAVGTAGPQGPAHETKLITVLRESRKAAAAASREAAT